MRPRHKAPQTFSLWMVDVMCCSLGTVILLWLVYSNRARESGSRAEDLDSRIVALKSEKELLHDLLERQVAELSALQDLLTALGRDRDSLRTESSQRQQRVDELIRQLAQLTENSDALKEKLAALAKLNDSLRAEAKEQQTTGEKKQKRIDDLLLDLKKLEDSKGNVEKLLAARLQAMEELEKKLAALGKAKTTLEEDLKTQADRDRLKQKNLDDLNRLTDDLTKKLSVAEATIKQLERTALLLPKLRDELKESKDKVLDEESKRKLLEADLAKRLQELAKASRDFETLLLAKQALEKKMAGLSKEAVEALAYRERLNDAEKKQTELRDLLGKKDQDLQAAIKVLERLRGDADRLKALAERRFAGVSLTGKKAVFVVDASGSMDLLDENTPALTKWESVRETLANLMTSMADLEKFQVVVFSEEVTHPLGREGEWIEFDPKTSPAKVKEALARIRPSGGTNLHKAFDATFKMRRLGLDTVYLFSDGLPSDGEGLTPEQDRATLRDLRTRAQLLTKHLRTKLKEDWNKTIPSQTRVKINSIGFFYESPDVGAFLWALSREHEGSFVGMSKP